MPFPIVPIHRRPWNFGTLHARFDENEQRADRPIGIDCPVRPRSPLFIVCSQQRFCVVEMARICPLSLSTARVQFVRCENVWWERDMGQLRHRKLMTTEASWPPPNNNECRCSSLQEHLTHGSPFRSPPIAKFCRLIHCRRPNREEKTFLSGWTNFQVPTSCALHSSFTMCNVWPLSLEISIFKYKFWTETKFQGNCLNWRKVSNENVVKMRTNWCFDKLRNKPVCCSRN